MEHESRKPEPKKTVLGLIFKKVGNDYMVLLMKRSPESKTYPDTYNSVSGDVDPGEEPETALTREVKEETGIKEQEFNPLKVCTYVTRKPCGTARITYIFALEVTDKTQIQLNGEHIDYKWVNYSTIRTLEQQKETPLSEPLIKNL